MHSGEYFDEMPAEAFSDCSDAKMTGGDRMDIIIGSLQSHDGEPMYSVKTDIPEVRLGVTEEEIKRIMSTNFKLGKRNCSVNNVNTNTKRNTKTGKEANVVKRAGNSIIKPTKLINISQDGFIQPGRKQTAKTKDGHVPFRIPINNKFNNIEEETNSQEQSQDINQHLQKLPPLMLAFNS
ncbi:hypothetical protein CEXT_571281 [Caerostris extrusa]|uniref:Uncharacterized protein n=1 Tax=Caerostris extrusa TaxID=172846 RepID=A0AAV4N842_CAEEX|nr:hypothetical protein CEXT_571281 [Caerostris extrusa]